MARKRKPKSQAQWRRMDLHLHTPASADYQEPGISFLDILRQAESKGLGHHRLYRPQHGGGIPADA
jgi:hypothetical protein